MIFKVQKNQMNITLILSTTQLKVTIIIDFNWFSVLVLHMSPINSKFKPTQINLHQLN